MSMFRQFKKSLSSGAGWQIGRELGKEIGQQALERGKKALGDLRERAEQTLDPSGDTRRDIRSRLRDIEAQLSRASSDEAKARNRRDRAEKDLEALKAQLNSETKAAND